MALTDEPALDVMHKARLDPGVSLGADFACGALIVALIVFSPEWTKKPDS